MKRYDRLIFATTSDTSAGPMAKAIMQKKYLLDVLEVTSRGLVVLFPEPINPKAEAVLASNGLTMKGHTSQPFVREDFNDRTLVLAFRKEVCQKLRKEFDLPEELPVCTLNEYVKDPGEVTNPYGGTLADYGKCFTDLETLISRLVILLNEEELSC